MFIQMGKAYELNKDGYVYALAIDAESHRDFAQMQVYLGRVEVGSIGDYEQWRYFSGTSAVPEWSEDESDAVPLEGLTTRALASAMYHPGTDRYLFLSGLDIPQPLGGALFDAPTPWGPWRRVSTLPGGYIPSLIPKGAGDDHVYFTRAGGPIPYHLQIGRIDLQ